MKVLIGKYPKKGDQKVSVRIDLHDTWSMDHTLAHIVVPMLKQLKETKHGIPNECWPEQQEVFSSAYWDETDQDGPMHQAAKASEEAAVKRWDDALDKMIWSFTQVNEDWEEQFYSEGDAYGSSYGPAYKLKCDTEGLKAYQARIQEGIDLFAEHYFDLWD